MTPVFRDGTATSGVDYVENTSALSFIGTAGEERTFTVSTVDDELKEDDETFALSLAVSDAPSGVRAGGATGTIIDDDGATVYVSIHDPDGPLAEGSSVELPVRMTSSVDGTVRVPWRTTGSAPASKIQGDAGQSNHEHEPNSGCRTNRNGYTLPHDCLAYPWTLPLPGPPSQRRRRFPFLMAS